MEKKEENPYFSIILTAILLMTIAEGLLGSSPLWFINPWSLFVTLPLYLIHFIFFLNLAIKLNKTDLHQLYLLGVIFGLYESWITKVVWAGYSNSEPISGIVLGLAIFEFLTLVFFYHPVFSFLLPIFIIETIVIWVNQDENSILPGHAQYLQFSDRKQYLFFILIIFSAALGASSMQIIAIITAIGSALLFIIVYRWKKTKTLSIYGLEYSLNKFGIIASLLFLMYIILGFTLNVEHLPTQSISYVSVLIIYVLSYITFSKSKSEDLQKYLSSNKIELLSLFKVDIIQKGLILYLISVIFFIITGVGIIVFLILNIIGIVVGLAVYIRIVLKSIL